MGKLYQLRSNNHQEALRRIERFSEERELQELRIRVIELEKELEETRFDLKQRSHACCAATIGMVIFGVALLAVSPILGPILLR